MTAARRSFRSADRLGSIVISFLVVDVVAAVLGIVTTRRELHLLERFIRGEQDVIDEVFEAIHRSTLFARIGLIAFATTAVSWCLWQHRSHANLHALEVSELEYGPGWAIAWWFVPIANIWRPFEAMRELWKASGVTPGGGRHGRDGSSAGGGPRGSSAGSRVGCCWSRRVRSHPPSGRS